MLVMLLQYHYDNDNEERYQRCWHLLANSPLHGDRPILVIALQHRPVSALARIAGQRSLSRPFTQRHQLDCSSCPPLLLT
jgi:hypothetical protein